MKILLVHNNYGKRSGEEAVVDKMDEIFMGLGHQVSQLRMTTEGVRESVAGKVRGFLSGMYSPGGVKAMRDALRREKPDVVNVHNLYPFISPAALFECRKAGVPVIMTIHNFRLICPTGLFMRDGRPCEECLDRHDEWGCFAHNCEHSRLKSTGYALRNFVARKTGAFSECVSVFSCITDFQRRKLIEYGFPEDRIIVTPNPMDISSEEKHASLGDYIGFCGRISEEKGVDLIIEAARRNPSVRIRLAGEVRDKRLVENLPSNIEILGYCSGKDLENFYRNSRFIIMASRCYEGFPMAILEGARYRKATIGPDHGGFSEIIGKGEEAIGLLFRPGDIDDLSAKLTYLWDNPSECLLLGEKAHKKLINRYSTEVIARRWQQTLNQTINKNGTA